MILRVKRSPFFPFGEKVADRPDEGAFEDGGVLKRPPHPGPLPQFFANMLPFNATQHPQKTGGEGATWRCPVRTRNKTVAELVRAQEPLRILTNPATNACLVRRP